MLSTAEKYRDRTDPVGNSYDSHGTPVFDRSPHAGFGSIQERPKTAQRSP